MAAAAQPPWARCLLITGLHAAFFVAILWSVQLFAQEPPLRIALPEAVGFSRERLRRLDTLEDQVIEAKEYAGVVTLVAHHGKVVHFRSQGKKELTTDSPLQKDAIFRLFSMTKPVTAVAMMLLYEEGKWSPQDPICKFIPEFTHLKVYKDVNSAGQITVDDPHHPPTLRELMTMTAGFSYGSGMTPVDRLYRGPQDQDIFLSGSLQGIIDRLAQAPLQSQPGSRWAYSISADIQGYIVEKLSGETLPRFMHRRIFEPLGMKDTAFYVPTSKRSRFATLYTMGDTHKLAATDAAKWGFEYDREGAPDAEPTLARGGDGLVSTAADFYRFAQMLLNGGELEGVRILSPQTVKLMMSNHLPDRLMTEPRGGGAEFNKPQPGMGYGFNGAVVVDPGLASVPMGKGSYLWDGAAGTWFWIDPTYDIVVVGMVQRLGWGVQDKIPGLPPNLADLTLAATYQALLRPNL